MTITSWSNMPDSANESDGSVGIHGRSVRPPLGRLAGVPADEGARVGEGDARGLDGGEGVEEGVEVD